MKKLVFESGTLTIDFNKAVTVHVDLENNKTFLELPGTPINSDQPTNK